MRLGRVEPVLRRALGGPCALPRGSRLLVAVSGGADSTALLLGLQRVAPEFGVTLAAAHLHHGLRGAEAEADLQFVEALCARLAVPLERARWNTRLRMRRRALSGEAGLRTLRREFLRDAARRQGADAIATAHTADDQLETVLMRLLRGTGLPGLGGMRPRAGRWLKPLLEATRADLEADLRGAGESWREDASNREALYTRNRLRHGAVPALLLALDPGADVERGRAALARRVARAAREVREADRAIRRAVRPLLAGLARRSGDGFALASGRLTSSPRAVRRALLRALWRRNAPDQPGLTHRHLESLLGLLGSGRSGARVGLPGGWAAERDRNRIRFGRPGRERGLGVRLTVPGRSKFVGGSVQGGWASGAAARRRLAAKPAGDEWFAAEGLEGGLAVRTAGAEEVFTPFGGRRPVRLGEFLKKQQVSRQLKCRPTVLADAGGILWVIGVRRSARAPVSPATRRALWVHVERHD